MDRAGPAGTEPGIKKMELLNIGVIVSRLKSKCTIGVILLTLCITTIPGLASAQSDLQFKGNSVTGSRNGIFVDSQSTKNTLVSNNASKNDIDINNADGLPLNVNGNELQSNNCSVGQPSGYCITK